MSEVKLVLNPGLRVFRQGEAAVLISEKERIELPGECLGLLEQLRSPTDIDEIAPADRAHLERLANLRLLQSSSFAGLSPECAGFWLAQGFPPGFVRAQLDLSIQFVGPDADRYRELMAGMFPECRLVAAEGALTVIVTHDLLACELAVPQQTPAVLLKTTGMKQSIGPVLSPAFTYEDLRGKIERPFDADLSVQIPSGLQATADRILLTELYQLRVRAAAHRATNHVVEWDLSTLSKRLWKVKP
jgi:hypothetical protein